MRAVMSWGLVSCALCGLIGILVLIGLGKTVPAEVVGIVSGAVGALGGAYMAHQSPPVKKEEETQ